jgi:UDPglucose--hexose-1-phosphate uridylyltransferase
VKSELRQDPISGEEVIVAPGRASRPQVEARTRTRPASQRVASCSLCPGNEERTPPPILTLPSRIAIGGWSVRVIPNLYPVVEPAEAADSGHRVSGVHEVVVETPRHDERLEDRDIESITLLLETYQARLRDLEARPATRYVQVFKNHGLEGGASLEHPHSQIVALDFIPVGVRRERARASRYLREKGACLLCAMLEEERRLRDRLVFQTEGFVAFAPFASRWAGEVFLVPAAHQASFGDVASDEASGLAGGLKTLLTRLRDVFGAPAYNLVLHTSAGTRYAQALHWYWQLTPRLGREAGLEIGTGLRVNSWAPEDVARLLREATS